ncbi:MAG: hypothetical protein FWH43_03350 [Endomicrobia bacterium]|nr:hypothetical protein [Endomicrobiia bacterium]
MKKSCMVFPMKFSEQIPLFKRKFVIFFILACMSINGFVTHINNENNKYSFVMIAMHISKNASMQVFSRYGSSMLEKSNKICVEILNTILPSKDKQHPADSAKKDKKHNKEGDSYVVYAVINNAYKLYKRISISEYGENSHFFCFELLPEIFKADNKCILYLYGILKKLIIPFFIIFIASIRKRKGRENVNFARINNLIWKRRVSA